MLYLYIAHFWITPFARLILYNLETRPRHAIFFVSDRPGER